MRANEFVTEEPRTAAPKPEIVSVQDDGKTITIKVRGHDGSVRALSNSNPAVLQQQLNLKYGLRLPHSIARKFVGMPAAMAEDQADNPDSWESQAADAERDEETAKMAAQDAAAGGLAEETVDEDLSRRGFLRGLGAAAVAGAAGGVATKANAQQVSQWVKYATDLATKSMGRIHQDTGYDLRNWLVVNVSNWVTDYCTKTNSYNAKEVIDYCNQQGLEASGLDKQNALVTAFLTNMKNRYQDFLSAYRAGINESFQKFNAAVQSKQQEKNAMGNLGKEEFDVLIDALIVYAICKDRQLDNSDLFKAVAASIKRFIDANNAKDYVNSIYPKAKQSVEVLKNNPELYQKESAQFFRNAGSTIEKLDRLSSNKKPEFESVNQGVAEGSMNEKSTSQAQFRTMAAAAHNPKFAKKVGISPDVAREFHGADKKSNYKSLPRKAAEDASWGMAPESRGYRK